MLHKRQPASRICAIARVCGKDDAVGSRDEGKPLKNVTDKGPTHGNVRRAILRETAALQGPAAAHRAAWQQRPAIRQRNPLVPAVSAVAAPTRLWP
ncbi:hypothetical protein MTO96_048348 [Rhipicephalus appendiculatus]